MAVFQIQYDATEKSIEYPDAIAFLSTNAQGKSDLFFAVLQAALESYTSYGFPIPSNKAEINNFLTYFSNTSLVSNAYIAAPMISQRNMLGNNHSVNQNKLKGR